MSTMECNRNIVLAFTWGSMTFFMGVILIAVSAPGISSYNHVLSLSEEQCLVSNSIISKTFNSGRSYAIAKNVMRYGADGILISDENIVLIFPPTGKTYKENVAYWIITIMDSDMITCYYDAEKNVGYITPEGIDSEIVTLSFGVLLGVSGLFAVILGCIGCIKLHHPTCINCF